MPCGYKRFPEEQIPSECLNDLEEAQKFLGTITVSVLSNKGRLDPENFYEESVIRESVLLQS